MTAHLETITAEQQRAIVQFGPFVKRRAMYLARGTAECWTPIVESTRWTMWQEFSTASLILTTPIPNRCRGCFGNPIGTR